jgi:hypothetical protein
MTQYLLSLHHTDVYDKSVAPADLEAIMKDVDALSAEMMAQGVWVFGGGLHPSTTATVVRVEEGEVLTTDGPYLETKEQLGGFTIIEAADLDAALKWGAKMTAACRLPVEVRPFQGDPSAGVAEG